MGLKKIKKVANGTVVNNYINDDTGEVLETTVDIKHHKIMVGDKESFSMVFNSIYGALDGLNPLSMKVMLWCSHNCFINKNEIILNKHSRKYMSDLYKCSDQSIKNAISSLSKNGVLIKLGASTYKIHPNYFWRGDMATRNKSLKYILELSYDALNNAKEDFSKKGGSNG